MNTTATNFLYTAIDKLAGEFPFIQFSYAYNDSIDTHVVQIEPLREYYENQELDNAWIPVALEFESLFDEESVCFISSDSTLAINEAEKSWNKQPEFSDFNQFIEGLLDAEELELHLPTLFVKWTKQNEIMILDKRTNQEVTFDADFKSLLNHFMPSPNIRKPVIPFKSSTAFADESLLFCAA